jgi:hypothetical protein
MNYQLLPMQKAIYDSLLAWQQVNPQLSESQYNLFKQIQKQVKKNKSNTWRKQKTSKSTE